MKKMTKRDMFMIIIGGIICSVIVVLADTIAASLVTYDTSSSHTNYNTVQSAVENLYNISENLYSMVPSSAGLRLVINGVPGLSSTLIDELYRFQGTTADNYICFGTTDEDTCTGDTNKYMYRIIGVNTAGQMKLIKKEALNTAYQWHSASSGNWPNSALKAGLNGSYFLTNTTYVPSGWEDRIATTDWHYLTTTDSAVSTIGSRKLGAATTQEKIGLIYLHDYADAYNATPQYNKNSWIFLFQSQNDSSAPNTSYEWTITRTRSDHAWRVDSNGSLNGNYDLTNSYSVRPVFYLTSSQVIASGTGTLEDPYILA